MSQLKVAVEMLRNTANVTIKQTDLLSHVAYQTGTARDSVRGTVIGMPSNKLMGQQYFKDNWVYCRDNGKEPTRFVRKGHEKPGEAYEVDYDTPNKKAARERILEPLKRITVTNPYPKVLTMGGDQGLCVRRILEISPLAHVFNAEKQEDIFQLYQSLGYRSIDFCQTIGDVIRSNKLTFDLINYDSLSYACDYIDDDMQHVNKTQNTSWFAFTQLNIQRFRNHGVWARWAKKKFYKYDDPTREWIKFRLDNYVLTDHFVYNRDPSKNTRSMRVFLFGHKDICDTSAANHELVEKSPLT